MASKLPNSINLLEPVNAPDDVWETLYYWVFNVGKYLFVFVEVLVLLVFASRFVVDKRNNDLSRDINEIVDQLSTDYYRNIDIKYSNIHTLFDDLNYQEDNQIINSKVIASVLDGLPTYIEMESFNYSDREISLSFTASDLGKVNKFEEILNRNSAYENVRVSVKRVEGSPVFDCTVNFSIVEENLIEDTVQKVAPQNDDLDNILEEVE